MPRHFTEEVIFYLPDAVRVVYYTIEKMRGYFIVVAHFAAH